MVQELATAYLTQHPLDLATILARVQTPAAGAVVLFVGTTREMTGGRRTESLDYEAYAAMAERKLAEIEATARQKWPILECAIVHRLGHLLPGEASVAVAVATAHRREAFEAGKWLIDTLKHEVPIWKRENWADGTSDWQHPCPGCVSNENDPAGGPLALTLTVDSTISPPQPLTTNH